MIVECRGDRTFLNFSTGKLDTGTKIKGCCPFYGRPGVVETGGTTPPSKKFTSVHSFGSADDFLVICMLLVFNVVNDS